jgi:hypothetical protein
MPRRGEYLRQHEPQPVIRGEASADEVLRVGMRVVTCQRHGQLRTIQIDPGDYACARLAAELADE